MYSVKWQKRGLVAIRMIRPESIYIVKSDEMSDPDLDSTPHEIVNITKIYG